LQAVADGKIKRLIVCMPPRHTKSEYASYLFPAWIMGRDPTKKIIQATHTAELAVGFGRKVKGLIESEEFAEVFPGVKLAADAKASGRWSTNKRGEYYACISPDTLVLTSRGEVRADGILPGDFVLSSSGRVRVNVVFETQHDATVVIGGAKFSMDHPIWTMNRGWVDACNICADDLLYVESIYDKVKARAWRAFYGFMEHAFVQKVVSDKKSLSSSAQRKVASLRRAWHQGLRPLDALREFFGGHGSSSLCYAHDRSHRRKWGLLPGKLSLGFSFGAGSQQAQQCDSSWSGFDAACGSYGYDPRGVAISSFEGPYVGSSFGPGEEAQGDDGGYSAPDGIGWLRRSAAWVFERCGDSFGCFFSPAGAEGYLARVRGASQKLQGLLLGVRYAGSVSIERHEYRPFVNYSIGGDNTFFANGVLTHNCGVGGALAGRGADLAIIDDPISEQMALSPSELDKVYEWYTSGPRQRLQPGGAIIIVMTRWSVKDLVSRVLQKQAERGADKWEVIEFPAILPSGKPLWPEYWSLEELESVKATIPVGKWNAQYMQNPTAEEGAIIKREWWRAWESDEPPACSYVIQSYDTAFSVSERSDMSAISTWGIFEPNEDEVGIILLDAVRGRWEFPELKSKARELYDLYKPDMVLIEQKASGAPLTQELRRIGIPVTPFTPSRGADKTTRMNACAPMFESGMVWAPDTTFADEMIEECAAFPNGDFDDMADTMTQAILRFRQGGFVVSPTDYRDEDEEMRYSRRRRVYY